MIWRSQAVCLLLQLVLPSAIIFHTIAASRLAENSLICSPPDKSCHRQLVAREAAELLQKQLHSTSCQLQPRRLLYFRQQSSEQGLEYFIALQLGVSGCGKSNRPPCCNTTPQRQLAYFMVLLQYGAQFQLKLFRPIDEAEILQLLQQYQPTVLSGQSSFATEATHNNDDPVNFDVTSGSIYIENSRQDAAKKSDKNRPSSRLVTYNSGYMGATTSTSSRPYLHQLDNRNRHNNGGLPAEQSERGTQHKSVAAAKPWDTTSSAHCRTRRQVATKEVHVNVGHPHVQSILQHFLEQQERTGTQRIVITDVLSAKQQMLIDTGYQFEFIVGTSECAKNSSKTRYSCSASPKFPLSKCRIRATQRSGETVSFESISCVANSATNCGAQRRCSPQQLFPHAPVYTRTANKETKMNIHEESYEQLVLHVQSELNRRSHHRHIYQFRRTVSATRQQPSLSSADETIDQEFYHLQLQFVDTNCPKSEHNNNNSSSSSSTLCVSQFRQRPDSSVVTCDVRVSSLHWENRMRVLDMFCESVSQQCNNR